MDIARPCTVTESLEQSLKEMVLMHEGKLPQITLDDLFKDMEKWNINVIQMMNCY